MAFSKSGPAYRRLAADSSSIILLQKVQLLDVFISNYSVFITSHVYEELTQYGKKGTDELALLLGDKIVQISGDHHIKGLDPGESSVIALCSNGACDFAVLDDKKGAKYCKSREIPFINALLASRILFLAGVISEDVYHKASRKLIEEGYYSDRIIQKAAAIRNTELQQFMPL